MDTITPDPAQPIDLPNAIRHSLIDYFTALQGSEPCDVYAMMQRTFEKPMLELVMQHAQHNQSRAAQWLGLNRNTLRKKLLEHGLLQD